MTRRGILFVLIVVLLVAGAVLASIRVFATERVLYLEPDATGPNPFTPPAVFTSDSPPPPAPIDPSVTITTPSTPEDLGDNPGPVGGTVRSGDCDPELLIQYLNAAPERRVAWAEVLGVAVEEYEDYLRNATAARLNRDIRVTTYGFNSGEAVAYQAILAAGTSVLVDGDDNVTVRCQSGSPLKPPQKMDRYNCDGCPGDLPPPAACAQSCFEAAGGSQPASTTVPASTTTSTQVTTTTTRPPSTSTTAARRTTRATSTTRRQAARAATTTTRLAAAPSVDPNFFATQPRTFAPAAPAPPTTQPPTNPPQTAPTLPITPPPGQVNQPSTQPPTQPTSTSQDCELGLICL